MNIDNFGHAIIEGSSPDNNVAHSYEHYDVKHTFGVYYNGETEKVDKPNVSTRLRFHYPSGRMTEHHADTDLTPEQCRELAAFLNNMADEAEAA